jgi:hypothetical protein
MNISPKALAPIILGIMFSIPGLFPAATIQNTGPGQNFHAPDGSFTCPIPAGWRVRTMPIGGTPVHVFEPSDGGEDRILVVSGPATAGNIRELAQQGIVFVSTQLLPGVQPAGSPNFIQMGGAPAVEIVYKGATAAGQVSWWQGMMLKDQMYFAVLGGARAERAALVEKESRAIFSGLRPGLARPSADQAGLAAAIIGSWSFYDRSGLTKGSSSKQVTFYPNGRFEYTAATYMPDLPVDIDPTTRASGQYRLSGNMLVVQLDTGQSITYALQLVQGGGLSINGELFVRER